MASINVSEDDFVVVAAAANVAYRAGDGEGATALDKIARKINAALTGSAPERNIAAMISGCRSVIRWQDMPSTLIP